MKTRKITLGILGAFSLLLLTACSGTIGGGSSNEDQINQATGFFALDNSVELLPVEALAQKIEDYMGLTQGNSNAVDDLYDKASIFGGLDDSGIERVLTYSTTRHNEFIKIMNTACQETLSSTAGAALIFPNGGDDVSSFFSLMTGRVYSSAVDQVIQSVKNAPGFSGLTQDQKDQSLCLVAGGNILAQIGAVY